MPLNAHGRRQARLLAEALADKPLAAIYTSDLHRATETATTIAVPHHLTPIEDPRLRELFVGDWQGLLHTEVAERWPDAYARWRSRGWLECPAPGGETLDRLAARATAAVREIIARHGRDTVAIVSHGGTLGTILLMALGAGLESFGRIGLSNCSLAIVTAEDDRFVVWRLNDTSHWE